MDLPRAGHRWLTIVGLVELVCLGTFFPHVVQCEQQFQCDRTYASDVQCGLPVLRAAALPKHPSEAVRGEFPWHVAIFQTEYRLPVYSCGGSLVTDRFVLTAAHCVVNAHSGYTLSRDRFVLQIGYHELGVAEHCTQELGVRSVHVHPKFRSNIHRHDLAVLELERPVRFNDRILPICLDTDEEDRTTEFYRNVGKVPGWGYTEYDDVSGWLRMTDVPIVNYTRCLANNPDGYYHTIHDGMFCGGFANGTNVCNGDSGGGLVTFRKGRWELQGIVSFTALRDDTMDAVCDTEQYAGFVKVRHYRTWIIEILTGNWKMPTDHTQGEDERNTTPRTSEGLKLPTDCGKRQIATKPLIVNGVRCMAGQWPWHAAIFGVSKRSRDYLCGGTLVSTSYILTAASCAKDWHPRNRPFIVQLGQAQLWQSSLVGREVLVINVETSDDSAMALLRLEVDVRYDNYIQPICLPTPPDAGSTEWAASSRIGTSGLIAGYGQTDPTGPLSSHLQATLMPIVDSNICVIRGIFNKSEALRMFCAGHGNGTNACKGDEGGGFYQENQAGAWTITGVIGKINLYRKRCDPKGYVAMSDVASYIEWLLERIQNALAQPTVINAVSTDAPSTEDSMEQSQEQEEQQQQSSW